VEEKIPYGSGAVANQFKIQKDIKLVRSSSTQNADVNIGGYRTFGLPMNLQNFDENPNFMLHK